MNLVLKNPNESPYVAGMDISAVILGEGAPAVRKALSVLAAITHNIREEGRVIHQWWNLDDLVFGELRERAASEAATADLVFIGLRNGPELRHQATAWLKRWLKLRKKRPGALVAVLNTAEKGVKKTDDRLLLLREAAVLGNLDFFNTWVGDREKKGNQGIKVVSPGFGAGHIKSYPPLMAAR